MVTTINPKPISLLRMGILQISFYRHLPGQFIMHKAPLQLFKKHIAAYLVEKA
jgi:hypothetical protein